MIDDDRLSELFIELRGEPHPENEGQKEVAELIRLARTGLRAREAFGLLTEEIKVNADGTHLICSCGRKECHSLWLSSGDVVYRVSYVDIHRFREIFQIEEDPTPWCHACGAKFKRQCHCRPVAEND